MRGPTQAAASAVTLILLADCLLGDAPLEMAPVARWTAVRPIPSPLLTVAQTTTLAALTLVRLLLHGCEYRSPKERVLACAGVRQ